MDRESNPGLPRGRREFYHWTIHAYMLSVGEIIDDDKLPESFQQSNFICPPK